MKNLMVIAGEASGDLHGSGVIKELLKINPELNIFGIGGDLMKQNGMELIYHCKDLSVMGFFEVIRHLPKLLEIENRIKTEIVKKNPDAILLIDYPTFNLRIAKFAKQKNIKIGFYISPQIWAWKQRRIYDIRKFVDKIFVVFQFEKLIYEKINMPVEFVGHPLLEELRVKTSKSEFRNENKLHGDKIIGLIPGSRTQEIDKIFPVMIKAAVKLKKIYDVDFVVPIAPNRSKKEFEKYLPKYFEITFVENQTLEVMKHSDLVFVTSGTATLETALMETPMAIVYKTSWVTYLIGKIFIKIKNIGLVNIVAEKEIVPEFIQNNLTADNLFKYAKNSFENVEKTKMIKEDLKQVKSLLGSVGASKKVAEGILSLV